MNSSVINDGIIIHPIWLMDENVDIDMKKDCVTLVQVISNVNSYFEFNFIFM